MKKLINMVLKYEKLTKKLASCLVYSDITKICDKMIKLETEMFKEAARLNNIQKEEEKYQYKLVGIVGKLTKEHVSGDKNESFNKFLQKKVKNEQVD